jgi:hypothetical protein
MSEPPRQAPQPQGRTPRSAVPIARGYGRDGLVRVVEALAGAGIEYEVAEEPGGESPGAWSVRVPITSAPRAIAALAALAGETAPGTPSAPHLPGQNPGPLFQGSSGSLLRTLVVGLCFGLAVWLALRGGF